MEDAVRRAEALLVVLGASTVTVRANGQHQGLAKYLFVTNIELKPGQGFQFFDKLRCPDIELAMLGNTIDRHCGGAPCR